MHTSVSMLEHSSTCVGSYSIGMQVDLDALYKRIKFVGSSLLMLAKLFYLDAN